MATIKLTDQTASTSAIIKWIQLIVKYPLTVYEAKPYADLLKAEGVIHPDIDTLNLPNPLHGEHHFHEQRGICSITVEIDESDFEKDLRVQQGYWDLCKRGTEGDAEAAIAFWKARSIMEHLLKH